MGVFVASILDHGKPERRPWCATEGCIYHAYRLADAMDPAADPCEDFYAYTCGHWEGFEEGAANQAEDAAMALSADILESLGRPLPSNRLVGTLVRMCVENKAGPPGSAKGFIDFARALGLPVDKSDAFRGNPVAQLVTLSTRWNVDLLLSLQVVTGKHRTASPFLLLTSPKKQRLREVHEAAGRYAERHLRGHLDAFVDYSPQRLRAVQNDLLEAASFEFEKQETLHLADIAMRNFSAREWLSLLNDIYNPEFVFGEDSIIVLENGGVLSRLDAVLKKYTRKEVVATVCWMFVHDYLWLLTDLDVGGVRDTGRSSSAGENDTSLLLRHRPAECLQYVDTFLGIISGANYVQDAFSPALVRLLEKSGVAFVTDQYRVPVWQAKSRAEYYQKANCKMADKDAAGHAAIFPALPALVISYAVATHQRDFYRVVRGTGLNATSGPQLFFLSYCYAMCSANGSRASSQCNLPLRHFSHFARAFRCLPGSAMTTEGCTFFSA
ncbi:membrane metallo-endopeptidase-like 1 [Haemaphysalis longicornis]